MDDSYHIADLVAKKIRGTINPQEQEELDRWMGESPDNRLLYERASDPRKQLEKMEIYRLFDKEKVWANLEEELFQGRTVQFVPRKLLRYAAAILLPLIVGGGFAYMYLRTPSANTIAEIDSTIKPGSQNAVLILSDGGSVDLGQGEAMATLQDGDASITDENQSLSYSSQSGESVGMPMLFNELRTPRGGGYNLQLADGTRVWLNSGSSLRYPVSFHDSSRQVFLEGEAYFEVSHTGQAFTVSSGNMNTRVLGTSFNISAYADDEAFITTLVEGKVSVELVAEDASASTSAILEPDMQATLFRETGQISTAEVSASGYTSWIQGKIEFHNEILESVMKRLARWYDFEYTFENSAAREFHFSARLDKEESISAILEMLEMTTDVKFEFRENSIVVL